MLLERSCNPEEKSRSLSEDNVQIVHEMNRLLGSYSKASSDEGRRRRNLELILNRAARLAFLLFSQPGTFVFDFSSRRDGEPPVFPGLVEVVSDRAQRLSPPRVLSDREFATAARHVAYTPTNALYSES